MSRSARAPCVPETFLRVLGPKPYRVAYVQPSRRPADGRYGENPNRLYKHQQLQVILKPTPDDVIDQYLGSLKAIGIDLSKHDIKFEEDNWESPTLGAWGIGWQVMLDGLEITAVHVFPAVRRHRSGSGPGRADVWPGTGYLGVPAKRRLAKEYATSNGLPGVKVLARFVSSWKNCRARSTTSRWPMSSASGGVCFPLKSRGRVQTAGPEYEKHPEKQRYPVLATYELQMF